MAYTIPAFPTKKALKEAVSAGARVEIYQPGGLFPATTNGDAVIEGPEFPKPHRWYAQVKVVNGLVTAVK